MLNINDYKLELLLQRKGTFFGSFLRENFHLRTKSDFTSIKEARKFRDQWNRKFRNQGTGNSAPNGTGNFFAFFYFLEKISINFFYKKKKKNNFAGEV